MKDMAGPLTRAKQNSLNLRKVMSLYSEEYAEVYDTLYLDPWKEKHELNRRNISRILDRYGTGTWCWLDTCCGQAWHFSQFPDSIQKVGIDISAAQLRLAAKRNPGAFFIRGSIVDIELDAEFDLVTNFWGSYCYLDDPGDISTLLENAVGWLRRGGSLYFEILLPGDLKTFNESVFARTKGFRVLSRNADFSRWCYQDSGGCHYMLSPPLSFFKQRLNGRFEHLTAEHDRGFMTHLIATGKK